MINTFITCLVAALISVGCQKADNNGSDSVRSYTVSSISEFKALSLCAGDEVVWKDGIYADVKFSLKASGTAERPIVLRAETAGGVVFTGTSGITLSGSYVVAEGFTFKGMDTSVKNQILTCAKGSSHCRFSNILIDGDGTEYSTVDTKWVNLYGHHNEVSHCTFLDKRNMGTLLVVWLETGIVPEHVIAYNSFTRPFTHFDDNNKARNGQETIRIGTSDFSMQDAKCRVYGNYFYNCHGEIAEIISNKSCGNEYYGNVFEDSKGTLTLRHGNNCIVIGNFFTCSGISKVGGVRIIGENHIVKDNVMLGLTGSGYQSGLSIVMGESNAALNGYWTVRNAIIENNTFVNCNTSVCINVKGRTSQDTAPENVLFVDNTLVCAPAAVAVEMANPTPESEIIWQNNCIYGGVQKGTDYPTVSVQPQIRDYTGDINEIKSKAGIQW